MKKDMIMCFVKKNWNMLMYRLNLQRLKNLPVVTFLVVIQDIELNSPSDKVPYGY